MAKFDTKVSRGTEINITMTDTTPGSNGFRYQLGCPSKETLLSEMELGKFSKFHESGDRYVYNGREMDYDQLIQAIRSER